MAQIDNGPATGNGVLAFGPAPTGAGSIEVHVPSGLPSLNPCDQANPVSFKIGTTLTAQTTKNNFFGQTAFVKFLNPA